MVEPGGQLAQLARPGRDLQIAVTDQVFVADHRPGGRVELIPLVDVERDVDGVVGIQLDVLDASHRNAGDAHVLAGLQPRGVGERGVIGVVRTRIGTRRTPPPGRPPPTASTTVKMDRPSASVRSPASPRVISSRPVPRTPVEQELQRGRRVELQLGVRLVRDVGVVGHQERRVIPGPAVLLGRHVRAGRGSSGRRTRSRSAGSPDRCRPASLAGSSTRRTGPARMPPMTGAKVSIALRDALEKAAELRRVVGGDLQRGPQPLNRGDVVVFGGLQRRGAVVGQPGGGQQRGVQVVLLVDDRVADRRVRCRRCGPDRDRRRRRCWPPPRSSEGPAAASAASDSVAADSNSAPTAWRRGRRR